MVLSTEWSQVEVIDLINDGSGLGFGIVGGRSTGVVIKSILPGGIADKDGRLQSGDHILQIGDVNLRGLGSDQVASVLRQTGPPVRMVVARSVEPNSLNFQTFGSSAPIVPTKILTDPDELDRILLQNGYSANFNVEANSYSYGEQGITELDVSDIDVNAINVINTCDINITSVNTSNELSPDCPQSITFTSAEIEEALPETERYTVELNKNEYGLGITIAGYVCEREDLCGIFIKSISEGSEASKSEKIQINDRIVEVDGQTLDNCTNHQAVEKLKQTGSTVQITLERYLRGPKYEHLQEALAIHQDPADLSPPSPSVTTLSWIPIDTEVQIEAEGESVISVNSEIYENNPDNVEVFVDENFEADLTDDLETSIKSKWESIVENKSDIVVIHIKKLKGLGISLEGTVEVDGGVELHPRHFIRSILPDGPVGQNGKLNSGDELLEVNGQKLLGLKHVEVVKILKSLPSTVRIVCSRKSDQENPNRVINTSQDREGFEARNILGGSLNNLLPQIDQKLVKAVSDTSLNTTSTVTVTDETSLQKPKSQSLENTNLAMWEESVEYVELGKGDRGLGFSILDYQDPVDPKGTVIVIRSLVPNGPAELDGRIKPGDRLISVNDETIKNVTLDQAVQALKGTLPGIVKLGVSKPLPISSRPSESQSSHTLGS